MKKIFGIYIVVLGVALVLVKLINLLFDFGNVLLWLYAVGFVVATSIVLATRK
jgi:hypothetical protein